MKETTTCFVLFYVLQGTVYTQKARPYHSVVSSPSSWSCTEGYFKTQAPQNMATCKRCSRVFMSNCTSQELYVQCTPFSNAECMACPPLPPQLTYSVEGCQIVQCSDSNYNNKSTSDVHANLSVSSDTLLCLPCPIGFYCANGTKKACMDGGTTASIGSSTSLQCLPTSFDTAQEFEIDIIFNVESSRNIPCMNLYQAITSWLEYGTIINCNMATANYSKNVAGVQCIVVASTAYSSTYLQWLTDTLLMREIWIQGFLSTCFGTNQIMITNIIAAPSSQQVSGSLFYDSKNSSSANASLAVPYSHENDILYERRVWGQAPEDVTTYVLHLVILTFSMCISMCMLINGLLYTLCFKKTKSVSKGNMSKA